ERSARQRRRRGSASQSPLSVRLSAFPGSGGAVLSARRGEARAGRVLMARIWPFAYLVRNSKARGPRRGAAPGETPIRFRFNGRRYRGVAGDTLASALLANGCARIGWSARYHRPRGSEALVRIAHQGAAAPVPARDVELYEGLNATSATSLLPDLKTLWRRAAS